MRKWGDSNIGKDLYSHKNYHFHSSNRLPDQSHKFLVGPTAGRDDLVAEGLGLGGSLESELEVDLGSCVELA